MISKKLVEFNKQVTTKLTENYEEKEEHFDT
jgi:hypothetical protein